MHKKTYYYHDLLNDDFAGTNIKQVKTPDDFKYSDRNPVYVFFETLLRLLLTPILWFALKASFLQRIKNKRVIRKAKCRKGFFIYGNHTNYLLDAYTPSIISFPRKAYIVANPDAISIKGLRTIVRMLGAIPIPSSVKGMRNYRKGIDDLHRRKKAIAIYPEAHIWPYYTDIRPFGKVSFHYPYDLDAPCFSFTNVYVKRKFKLIKKPKVITYIDGPFYPDKTLPKSKSLEKLRNEVYSAMKRRIDEHPRYEYAEYVYVDDPAKSNAKKTEKGNKGRSKSR